MNQPIPTPAYEAVPTPTPLPLLAVQRLGARTMRDGMYIGLIVALVVHVAAVGSPDYTLWMMHATVAKMNRQLKAYFDREDEIEIEQSADKEREQENKDDPVEEPEPIIPDVQEPDPKWEPPPTDDDEPEPAETDDTPYPDEPYEDPAPLAAEAQDVLTADGAVDMTGAGWDILDNDGSTSRATGATARKGRKEGHVSNPNARSDGVKDGTGKGPPKPKPKPRRKKKDLSRPASVIGGSWGCPFPPQANLNQIDRAAVTLSITVGTDGRAKSASVVSDPGYGFGAQARRCAMSKRYRPALNRDGKKITKTIVVRVRFTRS